MVWTGDLALNATVTISYTVTADNPDPGDKVMASTVSSPVAGSGCLPGAGTAGCGNTVIVLTPALTIVMTSSQSVTTLGSTVGYTITVTNTGQTDYATAAFTESLGGGHGRRDL